MPPAGSRRAYNVAAQLLAFEDGVDDHPATARLHMGGGTWLTLRAARVGSGRVPIDSDIAVTIEPTRPGARRDRYCRSHALSRRESELVDLLAKGGDKRSSVGGDRSTCDCVGMPQFGPLTAGGSGAGAPVVMPCFACSPAVWFKVLDRNDASYLTHACPTDPE